MDNPLNNLTVGEDITDIFNSITVEEGKAKESGRPYRFIALNLANGQTLRCFVNYANYFVLQNAIEEARK